METQYKAPTITMIGSVRELTLDLEKCGGSADAAFPQLLSPEFAVDCDIEE